MAPEGHSEKDQEEKRGFAHWWKEFHRGRRLLIGLLLALCLAAFLHFREVRIEVLDPGTEASRYVVAQVDFEFPDDEATMILRQESFRDIGAVYKVEEREVKERTRLFKEQLVENGDWRNDQRQSTYEEVDEASLGVEDMLLNGRFTDPRTYQKMREMSLPVSDYHVIHPPTADERVHLPTVFWESVRTHLLRHHKFQSNTIKFVISYYRKFTWNLHKDLGAQTRINDRIEELVPKKFTKIRSGSRIVSQGEMVTSRHIAMMHAMKMEIGQQRNLFQVQTIFGSIFFGLIIVVVGAYFFHYCYPHIIRSSSKLALYATVVITMLVLAKFLELLLIRNPDHVVELVKYPILIPFVAILLTVLLGDKVALYTSCFMAVILGVSLAVEHNKFLVMNLITGIVAILASRSLRKRKQVFAVCGKVWIAAIPIIIAYNLSDASGWNVMLITDLLSTLAFLLVVALLIVGFLPILEALFHIMTDITLMEYMDPNNELLRRLSLEAPGTYQHSLVVGSLAEAAAQAIGANGLFCRVSTLYHDIGKLFNPHYFTENQMGGFNIHQLLTPLESTQVIIAHVTEGEILARKHGLPQSFIEIIRQHHGTTLVYYFYCKQVEQMSGDVDAVDDSQFRYPGPKPRSKESAIIMIADTIEAASRSLEDVSEEKVVALIDKLVSDKAEEGQFDECELTFEELGRVKAAIVKTLTVACHLRVKYPERKRGEATT